MLGISILKKSTSVKTGVKYSAASTLNSLSTMLVGFVNMRLLGPELLGIWQSITIVNAYLPFLQLGIQSGLNLELPILLGEKMHTKAMSCVKTGRAFARFLSILLFAIGSIVVLILYCKHIDIKILFGAVAVTFLAVISCYKLHYIATYRSASAFDKLTIIYFIDSFISLILVILIYFYQYYGLLLYQVLKEVFATLLMWYFAPYRKTVGKADKSCFILLLKRGVFMTCINQVKGVIESFPRLILLSFGGVVSVGLFSPALAVGGFMNLVPAQVAQYLQPQMGYKYGETKQACDMWKYLRTISLIVPLIMTPLAFIGWLLIPYVLEYIFPKYMSSLWPIRIMLIGFVFSTSFLTRNFIITLKAYTQVTLLYIIDALSFLVLPIVMIHFLPYDVTISLSIGLSVAYFISYIANYIVVRHTVHLSRYNQSKL